MNSLSTEFEDIDLSDNDKLNVVLLYDSTGSMSYIFHTVQEIAETILSIGSLCKNLNLSVVSFKDFDIYDNGIKELYNIKTVEDIHTFIKNDRAYGGGCNQAEAGMSALVRAMNNLTDGTGYLFYMITDDNIRFAKANYVPKVELKDEINNNLEKVDTKLYILENLIERLAQINGKLSIFGMYELQSYATMETEAKRYEVARPLVEIFIASINDVSQIKTVIEEDVVINLSQIDQAKTVALFGTELRSVNDVAQKLNEMNLSKEYSNMTKTSLYARTTTTTDNLYALISGKRVNNFLHFPIYTKPMTNIVEDVDVMINTIKDNDLLPQLSNLPSLGKYVREVIDIYGNDTQKIWYANRIGSITNKPTLLKQKVDIIRKRANNYVTIVEDNIHFSKGYFTLNREVKDWTKDMTPAVFLGMLDSSIHDWMLKEFLPAIKYVENRKDEPLTDIYDNSGRLKFIPSTYQIEGKFKALQLLSLLASNLIFTNETSISLMMVSVLIIRCEDLQCKELLDLATENLALMSTRIDIYNSKLHSANIQRLLLHDRVRPHLDNTLLNRVVKSFQINSFLFMAKRNDTFTMKEVLLELDPVSSKQLCTSCKEMKGINHILKGEYICNYCAIIVNDSINPVAINLRTIFKFEITGKIGPIVESPAKITVKQQLDANKACYQNSDVKLTCYKCNSKYYVWRIFNLSSEMKVHKCPKCRLFENLSDKTLALFGKYLDNQDKFNPRHHLVNLEFIKFHENIMKCTDKPRDNVISNLEQLLADTVSCVPQNKYKQDVVYDWKNKTLKTIINDKVMRELIVDQLHQDIDVSKFWTVENPIYPTTYDIISDEERIYSKEEIDDITTNGTFITTTKGKTTITSFPENILTLNICKICYTLDNSTLIWHCAFPICKTCSDQIKCCPICKNDIAQTPKLTNYYSRSRSSSMSSTSSDKSCLCCS